MKRVQKAAAALAALALTAAITLPAGAVDTTGNIYKITADTNTATCKVMGTYDLQTVYHVDVEWGGMEFTYTPGTWMGDNSNSHDDNEKLQYVGKNGEAVGWNNGTEGEPNSSENHKIKITNKSNANVLVELSYESTDPACEDHVGGFFRNTDGEYTQVWMERADKNVVGTVSGTSSNHHPDAMNVTGKPTATTVYLCLYGRPSKAISEQTEIGQVTLTLSAGTETKPQKNEGLLIVEQS